MDPREGLARLTSARTFTRSPAVRKSRASGGEVTRSRSRSTSAYGRSRRRAAASSSAPATRVSSTFGMLALLVVVLADVLRTVDSVAGTPHDPADDEADHDDPGGRPDAPRDV